MFLILLAIVSNEMESGEVQTIGEKKKVFENEIFMKTDIIHYFDGPGSYLKRKNNQYNNK